MPGDKYASIERPDVYRALRRQGYSKERAARIANSQKVAGATPGAALHGPGGLLGTLGAGRRDKACAACATRLKAGAEKVPITGNLCRVGGQFSACEGAAEDEGGGGGEAAPATPAKPPMPTAEQGAPTGADETAAWLGGLGLDPKLSEAMGEYLSGQADGEDIALNAQNVASLAALGLARPAPGQDPGASNQTISLTGPGKALQKAIAAGDIAKAMSIIEKAHERAAVRAERAAAREARRAERLAERERRRAEREARRGGGRSAPAPAPVEEPQTTDKAMRPRRSKLWRSAYAQAKGQGMDQPTARRMASRALRQDDHARARRSLERAAGRLSVFKDVAGRHRWLAVSSTAYRDQDGEIVSAKALRGAVVTADAAGQPRGPLRFWHVPGLDLGDCDYQAVTENGRFLIESGTFRDPAFARAVKAVAGTYQMSIGFTHPASEPDRDGVFHHIRIFERSLVPAGRASNPFTRIQVKEARMLPQDKLAALKALVGDDIAAQMVAAVQTTDKAAQAGGVAYKEAVAPTIYALPDGTPGIIQGGQWVALKAVATKEPMAPAEMMQAAMTEATDAEAEEVAEDAAEPLELMEMTADDLRGLIRDAIAEVMGGSPADYAAKMNELKAQYEAMGKAFGSMKEARETADASASALRDEVAELRGQLKELQGDLPAGRSRGDAAIGVAAPITVKDAAPDDPIRVAVRRLMPELYAEAGD